MYQPKIPIRGGGGGLGHIDLRNQRGLNPIIAALQQMTQQMNQEEQDALARRKTEAEIGQMGQQKQPTMKIQIGADGNTYTINPVTGEAKPVLTPDGKPLKASKKVAELLKLIEMARKYEEPSEIEEAIGGSAEEELLGLRGLEGYEEEVPSTERTWGWPTLFKPAYRVRPERTVTRKGVRKKVKSTPITEALEEPTATATHPRTGGKIQMPAAAKEERHVRRVKSKEVKRPPKPKEYPDAVWNEEHQMWTIVKNGRLMGIQ